MEFPGGCDERSESSLQAVPLTGHENEHIRPVCVDGRNRRGRAGLPNDRRTSPTDRLEVTGVDTARPGRRRWPARDLQAMPARS